MRWLARCGPVYNQPFWRGQAIAFVTVLVAVAIRASVSPFINGGLNFTFLFPCILVAGSSDAYGPESALRSWADC